MRFAATMILLCLGVMGVVVRPAVALDQAHRAMGERIAARAVEYLRAQQNDQGAWKPEPAGPAVTGLVVAGLLDRPNIAIDDPAVARGLRYILRHQKESGGIYDRILANYNTSICLMALGRAAQHSDDVAYATAIERAHNFLRDLQWADDDTDPNNQPIDQDHPFYGGAGYGRHGRPDLSNTNMMIAGLRDSGLNCKDPAYQRAMTFITRLQGTKANTTYGDQIEPGGGFIYATSEDKDNIGTLESKAGEYIDATGRSRLRAYGSMTYAGFMSYLYAQLDRDDRRVRDAYQWIRRNYTLDENPGIGMQGYYYYLHVFARAMSAWSRGEPPRPGDPTLITLDDGRNVDWANQLIDKLATLQRDDGSFVNESDRWMEGDPVLCAAYALLALNHALRANPELPANAAP